MRRLGRALEEMKARPVELARDPRPGSVAWSTETSEKGDCDEDGSLRVTIMWRPSPPSSLVNRDLTIRPGRRRGRWRAKSSARIHRSIACGREERRRGRRRVARSRDRDPLVTPPHDRCDFRRRHRFMLVGPRAGNGQQEDRRFEGTSPRADGYGKLIAGYAEGYPSRLVNRSCYSVEASFGFSASVPSS